MAPNLVNAPGGLFIFINKLAGFIAIPIACLVILGSSPIRYVFPPSGPVRHYLPHRYHYALVWDSRANVIPIHWMHVFTIYSYWKRLYCLVDLKAPQRTIPKDS